jgi:hypothetical protein
LECLFAHQKRKNEKHPFDEQLLPFPSVFRDLYHGLPASAGRFGCNALGETASLLGQCGGEFGSRCHWHLFLQFTPFCIFRQTVGVCRLCLAAALCSCGNTLPAGWFPTPSSGHHLSAFDDGGTCSYFDRVRPFCLFVFSPSKAPSPQTAGADSSPLEAEAALILPYILLFTVLLEVTALNVSAIKQRNNRVRLIRRTLCNGLDYFSSRERTNSSSGSARMVQ